ncbi:hypothetical protein EPD60_00795 [Flaviaesturariibacter flavus]|uniref:Uncharacterized protein n=1 Tax=Flaviaesturariibacter flavus TaxID=2502780 RepID=A0A4R1BN72_9BACT|nr:hypothetical protein [Flaviaesturariibacter flavus]TCJ18983.1 hypothetical protein EPD60_00795 [Flaviaesturariibacter flavus]
MKKYLLALLCSATALIAGAQSRPAVHKAATAPDRPAQSARADLYVQDKTNVTDRAKDKQGTAAKKTRNKKSCGKGCCHKS